MHDKGSWRDLRTEEDDDVETELEEEGLDNLLLGTATHAEKHSGQLGATSRMLAIFDETEVRVSGLRGLTCGPCTPAWRRR